jgi:spoIIIJ-associated protein
MSGEERRFFSGATLAQALMAASRHYHLPPEELAFRQLEKRHGFTHKARGVVVEVDPAAPRRSASAPAATPATTRATTATRVPAAPEPQRRPAGETGRLARPERAPRERRSSPPEGRREARSVIARPGDEHLGPVGEAAEALIGLAALDLEVRVGRTRDEVQVDLLGADAAWLAGAGAEALRAFEDLVRRMARTPAGESIPVTVDCLGRRSEREGELRSLALAAATAVRRTGRPVELDPLPPQERRVIHLALAEEPDLVTESRGDDRERRLEIRLRAPGPEPQTP